jgi:hypothetical protein
MRQRTMMVTSAINQLLRLVLRADSRTYIRHTQFRKPPYARPPMHRIASHSQWWLVRSNQKRHR